MIAPLFSRPLCYGLVLLLAFAPLVDGGTTYGPATVVRLGALALALAWLRAALASGGTWRYATPLDLPVALFMVLAAASAVASPDPYLSLQAFLTLASAALVFGVAAEVAREPGGPPWLVGVIITGGVLQAGLAVWQLAAGRMPRPAGTYFNPNHLAMALAMTGAALLALDPRARAARWARWAAFGLVVAGLVSTASRGGVLAAAAGWGTVGWLRWRWRAAAAGLALIVAAAVVPNPLAARVWTIGQDDPYAFTRVRIWRSAVERGLDHPLGVGLNLFRQSSQRYAFPIEGGVARYERRAESAHNDYLQAFAELGFPGLVVGLWGLLALAACAARATRAPGGPVSRPLAVGGVGAAAAVAAQALVDTPLHVPGLLLQAAVMAGVLVAAEPPGPALRQPALLARLPRGVVGAAVLLLGAIAALGVARHGLARLAYRQALSARDSAGPRAALPWLSRAGRLAPDSAVYADARASAALAAWRVSGDPALVASAEEGMRRAMALDSLDALRPYRLARLYLEVVPADAGVRRAALERARDLYAEAERLDPYGAVFPFERAEVLALLGDKEGAVRALERAVALEPRFLPARLELARFLAAQGRRDEARQQYAAIEAGLDTYGDRLRADAGGLTRRFLAVDRAAVRREAAALAEGAS